MLPRFLTLTIKFEGIVETQDLILKMSKKCGNIGPNFKKNLKIVGT